MGLKPGDLVQIDSANDYFKSIEIHPGDRCVLLSYQDLGRAGRAWKIMHGPTGRQLELHGSHISRIEL